MNLFSTILVYAESPIPPSERDEGFDALDALDELDALDISVALACSDHVYADLRPSD